MAKYYIGDIGTEILVNTGIVLSEATSLRLEIRKPSGKEVEWTGVLGPRNTVGEYTSIKYVVLTGDWDEGGWWSLQSYVVFASGSWRGATVQFKLDEHFH